MGQAKKNRMVCPVTGSPIQSAECGANRISEYHCPESCPQNPWSVENYDRQLEVYDRMVPRSVSRLHDEFHRAGHPFSPPDSGLPHMLFFLNHFFRDRDGQGRTFVERWKAEGYPGLNNDQIVMLEAQSGLFPTVIEVQQILDDRQVLAVDRLNPQRGSMRFVDRSLASHACRFSTLLVFIYKTPFFYRTNGIAVYVPEISRMEAEEIVLELVRHHKGPAKKPEKLREWLFENFQLIADSVGAVGTARYEALLRNIDAAHTQSIYRLNCPPFEFKQIMDTHPDIHKETLSDKNRDEGFLCQWVWTTEGSVIGIGRTVLCTIFLHEQNHIRLETSSAKCCAQAKRLFEKLLKKKGTFTGERTDDLSLQFAQKRHLLFDRTLVPKTLLENTMIFDAAQTCLPKELQRLSERELAQRTQEAFLRNFADTPIPALKGKTPRQAAASKSLRPDLLRLMKFHVRHNDETDIKQGTQTDINSLLKELNLDEIIFPPPPFRFAPPEALQDEPFDDEDDEWDGDDEWAPDDLDLEIRLMPEEVELRAAALSARDEEDLTLQFKKVFPEVYSLFEAGIASLEEPFRQPITYLIAQTVFLLFDPNKPTPRMDEESIMLHTMKLLAEIKAHEESPPASFDKQPYVVSFILRRIKEIFGSAYAVDRARFTLFLMGLVDELHEALYEKRRMEDE